MSARTAAWASDVEDAAGVVVVVLLVVLVAEAAALLALGWLLLFELQADSPSGIGTMSAPTIRRYRRRGVFFKMSGPEAHGMSRFLLAKNRWPQ